MDNQQEGNDSEEGEDMKGIVPSIDRQESEYWQACNTGVIMFKVYNRHSFNT